MNFKAVIFDFDGVIVDSEYRFVNAIRSFLENLGAHPTDDELKTFTGTPPTQMIKKMKKYYGFPELTEEDLEKRLFAMYGNDLQASGVDPIDGVQEFFDLLKEKGIKTSLATSRGKDNVLEFIENIGLHITFDVVVTHDDVTKGKPDPETFLVACERLEALGVKKEEMVIIEDSMNGIQAGISSGIYVIGLKASKIEQDTHLADCECFSYQEVKQHLGLE